jgi:hypothetical protein
MLAGSFMSKFDLACVVLIAPLSVWSVAKRHAPFSSRVFGCLATYTGAESSTRT